MNNAEAAALLVKMVSEFRNMGGSSEKFYEAVALACAALINKKQEATDEQ